MRHILAVLAVVLATVAAWATPPPRPGTDPTSDVFAARGLDVSRFTYRRALMPLVETVQRNQVLAGLAEVDAAGIEPQELGPTAVTGERAIPVLLAKYRDTGNDPFPRDDLRRELFSDEWPDNCKLKSTCTGTMAQYYREISYGQFTVTGAVHGWTRLSKDASHYQGADFLGNDGKTKHCNGLCNTARVGDLIGETVAANPNIRWEDFDNEGPDGQPNSGDDDGYVDFVAFVHPEPGGECNDGNKAIWSHRFSLSNLTGTDLETGRTGVSGDRIRIDDYVIMPAFACAGNTMIQIGVFAHEFGHAFGLPDLYDTSGKGSGLGTWCLMASGSWGGDGNSPERPSHMSAWAKSYLGWISPRTVLSNIPASLDAIERSPVALRVPISMTQYYLISNVRRLGFDSRLPADGLAIFKVNQTMVSAGLKTNTVNAKTNKGVELIEADGLQRLKNRAFRGGPGDLFPHTTEARVFDNTTNPRSIGKTAVCDIGDPDDPMSSRVNVQTGSCAAAPASPLLLPDPAVPASTSLRTVLETAATQLSEKQVRVTGTIVNKGANVFQRGGRDFVLRDAQGNEIAIQLPVPFETPAPRNDAGGVPVTMANLAEQKVEVVGVVTRAPDGLLVLKAISAEVLK
jgi:M6 family metalloprotease-like protein